MKQYLLSGSFAYDTILLHKGELHANINPNALTKLNLAFGIDNVKNELGGTGGNIAYNSALLDQKPILVGSLGKEDSAAYIEHLEKLNLDTSTLTIIENTPCAHAWILTDTSNNQITSFNVGSMKYMPSIPEDTADIWHLAPENPITTATLALEAVKQNKKYFFDPGQMIPYYIAGATKEINTLENIIKHSSAVFVNETEAELLEKSLNKSLQELVKENDLFVIRTLGGSGLDLITKEGTKHIKVAKTEKIVDPTGCGDAFRAGFMFGYTNGFSLEISCKIGATMGSFAIENMGGQNHNPTFEEINQRLFDSFSIKLVNKNKKPKLN